MTVCADLIRCPFDPESCRPWGHFQLTPIPFELNLANLPRTFALSLSEGHGQIYCCDRLTAGGKFGCSNVREQPGWRIKAPAFTPKRHFGVRCLALIITHLLLMLWLDGANPTVYAHPYVPISESRRFPLGSIIREKFNFTVS